MTYPVCISTFTPSTNAALSDSADIFMDCLNTYGSDHEIMMMAEECAELGQAVMKLHRVKSDPNLYEKALDHLAEEMADVRIMLEQMTMMFGNDKAVAGWITSKLARQRRRLAEIS